MISAVLPFAMSAFQVAIKFVHQLIQHLVGIASFSGSDKVWSADFNVPGCGIMALVAPVLVLVESEIDPDDVLVVTKQDGEFFMDDTSHCLRQFEMDRLDMNLGRNINRSLSVHAPVDPSTFTSLLS